MPFLYSRYHAPSPSTSACPQHHLRSLVVPFPRSPLPFAPASSSPTATLVIYLFNRLRLVPPPPRILSRWPAFWSTLCTPSRLCPANHSSSSLVVAPRPPRPFAVLPLLAMLNP
ncbi:hypothetical protein C8R46DRAFT_1364597, partial [Mycena filopes]